MPWLIITISIYQPALKSSIHSDMTTRSITEKQTLIPDTIKISFWHPHTHLHVNTLAIQDMSWTNIVLRSLFLVSFGQLPNHQTTPTNLHSNQIWQAVQKIRNPANKSSRNQSTKLMTNKKSTFIFPLLDRTEEIELVLFWTFMVKKICTSNPRWIMWPPDRPNVKDTKIWGHLPKSWRFPDVRGRCGCEREFPCQVRLFRRLLCKNMVSKQTSGNIQLVLSKILR